jgi:hypothetical protein
MHYQNLASISAALSAFFAFANIFVFIYISRIVNEINEILEKPIISFLSTE